MFKITVWRVAGDEWVHHPLALLAGEALLVVDVPRRDHLLGLEHLSVAPVISMTNLMQDCLLYDILQLHDY